MLASALHIGVSIAGVIEEPAVRARRQFVQRRIATLASPQLYCLN